MHRVIAIAFALLTCVIIDRLNAADDTTKRKAEVILPVPESEATNQQEMKAYSEPIEHTEYKIEMIPIPGGTFTMGSPDSEANRNADDEGPLHEVEISPFWMGKFEITWDQYESWVNEMDQLRRKMLSLPATPRDALVDGISKPTEEYTDRSFGMGRGNYPAICMTQHAARTYCEWLTAKTGRYYRLPTEAEWEYACRAGTKTAFSFGDDASKIGEYAWFYDNSEDQYQEIGQKKPNPWGLHDMHGNVSEWVLDQYSDEFYEKSKTAKDPLNIPNKLYPRVVRGGGWDDDPESLRSAARRASSEDWKEQDPQLPQSIWYHTDALSVGFRVVRPLTEPSKLEKSEKWSKTAPEQKDPED